MKFVFGTVVTALIFNSLFCATVFAATGTIDATSHFAWSNNGGWVNWFANGGNVAVTDSALTGYIWSADFGWINLSPSEGGVVNDGHGTLGGYAWGAGTGWINFSGVTIDGSGIFHGHTVDQSIFGTMTFDCTNCLVKTSWTPTGSASGGSSGGGGGGILSGPQSVGYQTPTAPPSQSASAAYSISTSPTFQSIPPHTPPSLEPQSPPSGVQPSTPPPTGVSGVSVSGGGVGAVATNQPQAGTESPAPPVSSVSNTSPASVGGECPVLFGIFSVFPVEGVCWWPIAAILSTLFLFGLILYTIRMMLI